MKILIADDDPLSLKLMERTLQNYGYEPITAKNGREAAQVLSSPGGPRLALIDWMMPELDGPGVCREVRSQQENPYVYMLLLTSKQSNEDVVMGLEAGADDYLTKPCHPAELKARLHTGRRVLQLEDKLVEAREEMRFKATHDPLTSLLNRGGILAVLQNERGRTSWDRKPVSLLLCDIDHFKQINDRHGHPVGDEVLQQVSSLLQDLVQPKGAVGRFGGEEFLIVLGACDAADLRERAERIRAEVNRSPFLTQQGPVPVALSIGAITIEDESHSVGIDLYLKEADAALYRAKAAGRNRVIYADAPTAASGPPNPLKGEHVVAS